MKIFLLLLLLCIPLAVMGDDFNTLMNKGLELHDKKDYQQAIAHYQRALKLRKDDPAALYELSFSYMADTQYEKCLAAAEHGLKARSKYEPRLYVTAASCLSNLQRTAEALQLFRTALDKYPKDAYLHLNIAVTLSKKGDYKPAISHLKAAIENKPAYPTPYFYLAELYRHQNYRIPAIYFFMKYTMLEPNTQRSRYAAKNIFRLMHNQTSKTQEGHDKITINQSPTDEGDFTKMEIMLALSSAAEEHQQGSPAEQNVKVLAGFVKLCNESSGSAKKNIANTFTWKHAADKAIALDNEKEFSTFAYYLAAIAGLQGAKEWLKQHQDRIKSLDTAMKKIM